MRNRKLPKNPNCKNKKVINLKTRKKKLNKRMIKIYMQISSQNKTK